MKKQSKVLANLYAQEMYMGGITIRQPFPNQKFQQLDPFLLLHHGKFEVPEHAIPAKTGVGPHPDTRLLFVSGRPLDEPIVSHGPFVMNNQTEILEAMRDYQMGKMGVLIEE